MSRALLFALTALACAPLRADDLAAIKARGTLRVIVAASEQPEMFDVSGKADRKGFERELLEGFTRLEKLTLQVVPVDRYDDRVPALLENKGDVVTGIVATEARRKLVDFALETMPSRKVMVSRKPNHVLARADQLRDEKVGILKGATTWMDAAVEAGVPSSKIQTFPDLDALFEAMRAGHVSATVLSLSDLGLAMRKDPALQPGAFLGPAMSAGWAVRKQDGSLKAALEAYLAGVRKAPTWSRLVVEYFGQETLLVLGRARE